jgi:hypothetical protein
VDRNIDTCEGADDIELKTNGNLGYVHHIMYACVNKRKERNTSKSVMHPVLTSDFQVKSYVPVRNDIEMNFKPGAHMSSFCRKNYVLVNLDPSEEQYTFW